MRNIFAQTKDYVDPPKRNVFDLSHSNHSTFQFGYLYPVICQPVIPGDSFDIDPTFALRFFPTAFPVQTKITANLHFFYVRNRNLWDKWTKFIGHTHDTEFPYLDGSQDCIKTGGLADYLGVPTTLVGAYSRVQQKFSRFFLPVYQSSPVTLYGSYYGSVDGGSPLDISSVLGGRSLQSLFNKPTVNYPPDRSIVAIQSDSFEGDISTSIRVSFSSELSRSVAFSGQYLILGNVVDGEFYARVVVDIQPSVSSDYMSLTFNLSPNLSFYFYDDLGVSARSFADVSSMLSSLRTALGNSFSVAFFNSTSTNSWIPTRTEDSEFFNVEVITSFDSNYKDVSELLNDENPFIASNSGSIRLNALPFRAYESIYNAFYRNEQNDPLMINGEPEYDKYLPNDGSGADSFPYQLYKRNWELDFLSSAVQSPQQGIAPLVGVSSSGDFTFVHKDDNGNIGYFSAKAQISADGKSISGVQLSDTVELDGLPTTPIVADIPEPVKRGSVYTLNQMALAGISINDFRNVNSLQRWLETNIRRGFKYRDQIKSHFGIDVDFDVLDMPEFIGGISEPVYSSQVNQTSESENDPLGSYAGQLSLIASSKHSIRHYCHEHGYIVGIFSVIPVPNYSQLLPKDFIKSNYLDFYFPEFSHIGMQPVDYREVCPLQAYGVNPDNLLKTFGYQRPWYDYIANVDSVHGLFRTNLRNFVLNRQFDTLPMLNKDFLQVDPSQLNDIFTVDDVSDKILGQIHFNITAKRPIPRFGIPRLE